MAEFGAHLTATSDVAPSIFEILASEGLANGLRAGFKFFIKILADQSPEQYGRIFRFQEEFYTGFDFIVQWIHLNRFGSSFSENFYCLRRVAANRKQNGFKLEKKELYSSLFFLVGFPYLHNKFLGWYSDLKHRENSGSQGGILETLCLKVYPPLHLVLQLTTLMQKFSYAVGRSRIHSPLLKLARVQLVSLTEEDLNVLNQVSQNTCNKALNLLSQSLRYSITLGAFTLQFLDWWYSQEGVRSLGALPIPPPPSIPLKLKPGLCPLCRKRFRNATLLTTSGIVFCYGCVHEHLNRSPVCPVTRYPSSHKQLVKLYLPEE